MSMLCYVSRAKTRRIRGIRREAKIWNSVSLKDVTVRCGQPWRLNPSIKCDETNGILALRDKSILKEKAGNLLFHVYIRPVFSPPPFLISLPIFFFLFILYFAFNLHEKDLLYSAKDTVSIIISAEFPLETLPKHAFKTREAMLVAVWVNWYDPLFQTLFKTCKINWCLLSLAWHIWFAN